jgi:hypothetical protein
MDNQFEIVPPDLPTVDTPPNNNKENNSSHVVGINIIHALYDFVTLKEPLGFSVLYRYKTKLDLKINGKGFYYIFLPISLLFDYFFVFFVYLIMMGILLTVFLAFVKGIGIFEWLPLLLHIK